MEAKVYNKEGKEAGKVTLKDELFNLPWNADLVHQVVVAMQANARTPLAHTKTRAEVSGTNQKPWRQKGTGRARHGQRISPIWKGGGIAHGPRSDRDYGQKINKKMRRQAMFTVLSQKLRDGEVLFIDDLSFASPKTADAKKALAAIAKADGMEALATKTKNAALIALPDYDENTALSFRNMDAVFVEEIRNLNPVQLLQYKYVIVAKPDASLEVLNGRAVKKANA